MAKIMVSFKEKEADLYNLVKSQGDQSNFIKDALKYYLQNKQNPVQGRRVQDNQFAEIMDL
jgi:hypothetical protein